MAERKKKRTGRVAQLEAIFKVEQQQQPCWETLMLTLSGIFSDEMKNVVLLFFFASLSLHVSLFFPNLYTIFGAVAPLDLVVQNTRQQKRGHVQAKRQKPTNRTPSQCQTKINENKINRRKIDKMKLRELRRTKKRTNKRKKSTAVKLHLVNADDKIST